MSLDMDMSLEQWVDALPREEVETEVERLEADLAARSRERDALDAKIRQIQAELRPRKQALALYVMVREPEKELVETIDSMTGRLQNSITQNYLFHEPVLTSGETDSASPSRDAKRSRWTVERPTTRQAIITVMQSEPNRLWKLAQIRDTMIERGWLTEDSNAAHRVQMMASSMVKAGQLVRPEHGFYGLPTGDEDEGVPSE